MRGASDRKDIAVGAKKVRTLAARSAVDLTRSYAFFQRSYYHRSSARKKNGKKKRRRKRRRTKCVVERNARSTRIHASVGPAGAPWRARNIKVSNYNARHDTSFRPSSIKSHETPGGHRYRVICTPVASTLCKRCPGEHRLIIDRSAAGLIETFYSTELSANVVCNNCEREKERKREVGGTKGGTRVNISR